MTFFILQINFNTLNDNRTVKSSSELHGKVFYVGKCAVSHNVRRDLDNNDIILSQFAS